ncbi:alpha amylase C-terminal domain-containing protein, partial [candidate division WOR-3 bacterium]|nr:alpha amylase C-terminal domain-containing protein [candidate division WOR-3 bacterium]
AVGALAPGAFTVAEESTAWPGVTRPVHEGGLGFGFKWNLGWMHDTLDCFSRDPIHRKFHHDRLCFPLVYAWSENFVLPLSHDEVVHGKRSLLEKLPGDDWRQFANLRLLLGWQWLMPGKKLLFQGGEFGARREWDHDRGLDWHELESDFHRGVLQWVTDLNRLYRDEPALWNDADPAGFEWVDCADKDSGVVSFLRKSAPSSSSSPLTPGILDPSNPCLLVVANLTPVPRPGYRVGVPEPGAWREILNSDAREYRGSGQGNLGRVESGPEESHGRPQSLTLNLPPLGLLVLAPEPETAKMPRSTEPGSGTPDPKPRHRNRR